MTTPAKIPAHRLLRQIGDMVDGESGHASPNALAIDPELGCWLDPDAVLGATGRDPMFVMRQHGQYHVFLPVGHSWMPGSAQPDIMIPLAGVNEIMYEPKVELR